MRGRTKPHRMTRFLLLSIIGLNFFSVVALHGNLGALVFSGIAFIQAIVIFFLSLWRGMGGTTRSDWICLVITGVGIVGWKTTGNPIIGILFAILADFVAYLPAFIKTWHHPDTESPWFYVLGSFVLLLGLAAYKIEIASFYQIYALLASLVMVGFIYKKNIHRFIKHQRNK
ncbi:MAG TPA: hypothetical protein VEW42_04340 [Candidatus Eisenbacteria bacterium]|nr:hypothetical protein [Candidatus Eisenbacteria bacterium]